MRGPLGRPFFQSAFSQHSSPRCSISSRTRSPLGSYSGSRITSPATHRPKMSTSTGVPGADCPLAEAGLSIFAISTFDTDYVLVKTRDLEAAVTTLEHAGHQVSR